MKPEQALETVSRRDYLAHFKGPQGLSAGVAAMVAQEIPGCSSQTAPFPAGPPEAPGYLMCVLSGASASSGRAEFEQLCGRDSVQLLI